MSDDSQKNSPKSETYSKCVYLNNFFFLAYPVTGSNPYFMYGDSQLVKNIDGMKPDVDKYTSYGLLEPVSLQLKFVVQPALINQFIQTRLLG